MIEHTVGEGECLASIAEDHGFFWKTLWDLAENKELRDLRKEPTILRKGDVVRIPDLRRKREEGATEATHRFRLKGVPALLRMRLTKPADPEEEADEIAPPDADAHDAVYEDREPGEEPKDEPWKNVPCELHLEDGKVIKKNTDGDGKLEIEIPPKARKATLVVEPGTPRERRFPLGLGNLDPLDTPSGACDRLANLGYGSGARSDEMTDEIGGALAEFQRAHGLKVTGELDKSTADKLKELHGS